MAGTLFSLALSQRLDAEGQPLQSAPLYIYAANTSTPVNVYSDFGLTLLHPWPLLTDSAGMIPAFWLADGQYRARFTDAAGSVVYFDIPSMQAVGPSSGAASSSTSVDANAIFATGDMLWQPKVGTRAGWVRANARTIGSASSGASERANADTQPLYEYLWNNFSDTLCPVTGSRGASAAADFAANKPIGTLDMRGRGPMGLDDMGNSAASVIAGGTPTAAGSSGGAETKTVAEANLPAHVHAAGTLAATASAVSDHRHFVANADTVATSPVIAADTKIAHFNNQSSDAAYRFTGSATEPTLGLTSLAGGHTPSISMSGSTGSVGSGTAFNTMDPYRLGSWYIRL